MSAFIMCVSSSSGVPIFCRKKGTTENLPFSTIGSLNGVHMFGKPFDIEILSTLTEDYVVAWKEFSESLTIIGIASGCSLEILNKVIELTFHAIVLIVGAEEVKNQRNMERLKRELRICYPIIDRLLDSLDCGDAINNKHLSDIAGYVETILCQENHLLQVVLDSFIECVESLFGCVLISGKIAVATPNWWTLHPDETCLLSLLANTEKRDVSKDIPVYLPHKSPTVAFRFVVCTLMADIYLCCLCGTMPVLNDIEHSVQLCFKNSNDLLNSALQCAPRNFPTSCMLDTAILGVLLINLTVNKYMITKNPQLTSKRTTGGSHRLDILRTFFYRSVQIFLISNDENDEDFNVGIETYWCSEYHKCHALKTGDNVICVLYNASIPTHAMGLMTKRSLKLLISDKQVNW